MSLLSLPNELLIRHIFSCNAISINDLKCMMISCHRLYKIIRESNELWRLKFLTRYSRRLIVFPTRVYTSALNHKLVLQVEKLFS